MFKFSKSPLKYSSLNYENLQVKRKIFKFKYKYLSLNYENLHQVKRKKMSQFDCDKLMSSLQSEVDYSNFKDVDIVIEAVFEDINLKHRIIKEVWDL